MVVSSGDDSLASVYEALLRHRQTSMVSCSPAQILFAAVCRADSATGVIFLAGGDGDGARSTS